MTNPYHIRIAPKALKQIEALTPKEQKNVVKLLEALSINPRPQDAKKVEGMHGLYAERAGHRYLVYRVEDLEVMVLLVR